MMTLLPPPLPLPPLLQPSHSSPKEIAFDAYVHMKREPHIVDKIRKEKPQRQVNSAHT